MEFLGERLAQLSRFQQICFGGFAVAGSVLLLAGCASANPSDVNAATVNYCSYSYEAVADNMLQVTIAGMPNYSSAQITRVEILDSKQKRQETAAGSVIKFSITFGTEQLRVFGVFGSFEPSKNREKRLQQALQPPKGAVAHNCSLSDTV